MKKWMALAAVALTLMGLLTACGGKEESGEKEVDLTAFYAELEKEYGWDDGYMEDIEGEMLESYYPGLSDITTKQFVGKMPLMSAVVNEMVFLQCETEEDASEAVALLQERVDSQAEGGAWYPESMKAWGNGAVIQQGTYVAMIAVGEYQEAVEEAFNALFA